MFDFEKLSWLNGKYLRRLSPQELLERLRGDLLSDAYLLRVLPLAQERIDKLEDFASYAAFFFSGDVDYDAAAIKGLVPKQRTPDQTAKALRMLLEEQLDPILEWNATAVEAALRRFAEARDWAPKELFMVVRIAVTGRAATPPLFDTMAVLGKEVCRSRLRSAAATLRSIKGA